MNMKKLFAVLLAICLMLSVCMGALAEPDQSQDLLQILLGEEEDQHIEVTDLAVTEGLSEDWTNILLLGTDGTGDTYYANTDLIILISVNANANQLKITSIMRDTLVDIPQHGQEGLNKACLYGGPELTVSLVNKNFGMNVEKYAMVNMECMVDIVDSLGGLTLNVSEAESKAISELNAAETKLLGEGDERITPTVPAGEQVLLDGRQVLGYARVRQSDSDYARVNRHRAVMVALVSRLKQENAFTLATIVADVLQYVETDLDFGQIIELASVAMGVNMDNLSAFRIPVDGTYEEGIVNNAWGIKADFEENTKLLYKFIYG